MALLRVEGRGPDQLPGHRLGRGHRREHVWHHLRCTHSPLVHDWCHRTQERDPDPGYLWQHGHLQPHRRAQAKAKAVLDATTFADFIGIVEFNDYARTYEGLTTLARAMPEFKEVLGRYYRWIQHRAEVPNMIAGLKGPSSSWTTRTRRTMLRDVTQPTFW